MTDGNYWQYILAAGSNINVCSILEGNTARSTGICFQENNLFNPGREKGSNMKWAV